jgi:hypothetical protein
MVTPFATCGHIAHRRRSPAHRSELRQATGVPQPEADLNFSVRAVDAGVIFCAPCTSPLWEADFETDIGGTSRPRRTDDKLGSGKR